MVCVSAMSPLKYRLYTPITFPYTTKYCNKNYRNNNLFRMGNFVISILLLALVKIIDNY